MSVSPSDVTSTSTAAQPVSIFSEGLLPQLVHHLRQHQTILRDERARRISEAASLSAMTPEELFSDATAVYDNHIEVLETGSVEAPQAYARDLSERIIPPGVETDEVVGIVLLLRDVHARSLFEKGARLPRYRLAGPGLPGGSHGRANRANTGVTTTIASAPCQCQS